MSRAAIVALALVIAPVIAHADTEPAAKPAAPAAKPISFEVLDRGDAVEVIAYNVKAARTAVMPLRSRLEVAIAGTPTAARLLARDATVKVIELSTQDAQRVLSVKLGLERADVKMLARFAQAIQVGSDLHVLIPRKAPVEGAVVRLPEPTISPAMEAALAAKSAARAPAKEPVKEVKPPPKEPPKEPEIEMDPPSPPIKLDVRPDLAKQVTPIAGKREAIKPDADPPDKHADDDHDKVVTNKHADDKHADDKPAADKPAADKHADDDHAAASGSTRKPAGEPAKPTKPAAEAKPAKPARAAPADDTLSRITLYAAIGLVLAGGGMWLMRKRRAQLPGMPASIEIIAQRSLGGRARVVWLSAGPREMIVSVTPQQVKVLAQWRKSEAAQLPAAQTFNDSGELRRLDAQDEPHANGNGAPERAFGRLGTERPAGQPHAPIVSPAVNGILRLRARTTGVQVIEEPRRSGAMPAIPEPRRSGEMSAIPEPRRSGAMPVIDDPESVAADEQWVKEILAATGARK